MSATAKVWLVFGIIFAFAVTGFWLFVQHQRTEYRRAVLALQDQQKIAGSIYQAVVREAGKVKAYEERVAPMQKSVSNLVQAVLGEPLTPPPVVVKAPARRPKPAAARKPGPAAPPAAPPPQPPPAARAPRDPSVPVGIMTREELEAMRKGRTAMPPPQTPREKTSEEAAQAEPPDKPKPEAPAGRVEPEIRVEGKKVLAALEKLLDCITGADNALSGAADFRDRALEARDAAIAAQYVEKLKAQFAFAESLAGKSKLAMEQAETHLANVETVKTRIETERAERKAEEERRRAEAEARARLEREIAEAAKDCRGARDYLEGYDFGEAVAMLARRSRAYRTEEAKAIVQVGLDRYRRLRELKRFLTERINAAPLRWGWGSAAQAKDVLAADEEGIKITGGRVPWREVPLPRMLRFIKHYLEDPKLPVRTLGEMNLATAVFFFEHERMDEAQHYSRNATRHCPDLRDEAERLVPYR